MTLEDGAKTVSFLTEIEGVETIKDGATPAMVLAMATRAMFDAGLLMEAAEVALAGIEKGELPSAAVLSHFKKKGKE
jgi:hypothetical protein